MPAQIVANPQFCSPAAATAPTVAAAGVAWTNTGWVQIAATTDTVWILGGISIWTPRNVSATTDFEVDIGTGAAASEVLIATMCGQVKSAGTIYQQPIWFPIGVDNLNGRHAFRIRTGDALTDAWSVKLAYFKHPITGLYLSTTQLLRVAPSAANPISMTSGGSAWTNGTPVQILASAAADLVITHAMLSPTLVGQMEVDLCIGAAAAEVPIYTFRVWNTSPLQAAPSVFVLPNPLDNIPAGSRVSMRLRAATASRTCAGKLMYFHKPL